MTSAYFGMGPAVVALEPGEVQAMNLLGLPRTLSTGPRTHTAVVSAGVAAAGVAVAMQIARARSGRSRITWAPGAGSSHDGALHARCLGGGGGGVVLLHGLGGSNAYWGSAYDTLAETGRLVVPDLLGFGASPRPPSGYAAADHVRALATVLDEVGVTGPVVVGAHSVGCLVAFALAEEHPDLVAGVVAFCPPLYPDGSIALERVARLGWLERQLATDGPWAEIACRWVCNHRRAAAAVASLLRAGYRPPSAVTVSSTAGRRIPRRSGRRSPRPKVDDGWLTSTCPSNSSRAPTIPSPISPTFVSWPTNYPTSPSRFAAAPPTTCP